MAKSPQPGLQTLLLHVLSRAQFGQKQLYGAQPLEKLTEQDLGRIHMWPDVWNRPLSSQVCKTIWPSSSEEEAGTGQGSGSCSLEFWAQV